MQEAQYDPYAKGIKSTLAADVRPPNALDEAMSRVRDVESRVRGAKMSVRDVADRLGGEQNQSAEACRDRDGIVYGGQFGELIQTIVDLSEAVNQLEEETARLKGYVG